MADNKDIQDLDICSFCGRSKGEVALLFRGETGSICNECAEEIFYMNYSILNGLTDNIEFLDELGNPIADPTKTEDKEEKKETKKSDFVIKTPREIKAYLDQYVIGQEDAKETLSIAAYNHYKRINQKIIDDVEIEKSNLLLLGPSGSGKTLLVKTLANFLDVPYTIADATSLTEAGYVGDDVESIITSVLQNCDYDVKKAEHGIVLLDEVDKTARKGGDNPSITRDVSGEGVQQGLLKLMEGTIVHVSPTIGRKHPEKMTIEINTKNMLFICCGAFEGIERIIKSRKNTKTVGFNTVNNNIDEKANPLKYIISDDLKKYGLIPELLGRLPVITYLNPLKEEDLVRILTEPKNAIIKQYKRLFKLSDISLRIDDSVYPYIAQCAIKSNLGARSLRTIVEKLMSDAMFNLPGSGKKRFHITLKYAKEHLKDFNEAA